MDTVEVYSANKTSTEQPSKIVEATAVAAAESSCRSTNGRRVTMGDGISASATQERSDNCVHVDNGAPRREYSVYEYTRRKLAYPVNRRVKIEEMFRAIDINLRKDGSSVTSGDDDIFTDEDMRRYGMLRATKRLLLRSATEESEGENRDDEKIIARNIQAYRLAKQRDRSMRTVLLNCNNLTRNEHAIRIGDTLRRVHMAIANDLRIQATRVYERLYAAINRYRAIEPCFFDQLVRFAINGVEINRRASAVTEAKLNPEVMRDILTHLLNYAPSATLAQLYAHIGENEVSFSAICEFCLMFCTKDLLFMQRTRFVLHRYLSLGDGVAVQIIDRYCYLECLLFPLSMRRQRPITAAALDTNNDAGDVSGTLNANGETESFVVFSRSNFSPIDMIKVCCEYLTIEAFKQRAIQSLVKVFSLANVIYWRMDGQNYVDVKRNAMLQIKKEKEYRFVKEFANQVISRLACDGNDDERTVVLLDMEDASEATSVSSKRKKNGGRRMNEESEKSVASVVTIAINDMVRFLRNFNLQANGVSTENMPNVMLCDDDSDLSESPLSDKFVRYSDKSKNETIALNLYLNRFEHITPAVTRLLSIDYEDFQPPQHMRFNEVSDDNITLYIRTMLDRAPAYFRALVSRDVVDLYLNARVIHERRNERDGNVAAAAAAAAADPPDKRGRNAAAAMKQQRDFAVATQHIVTTSVLTNDTDDGCNITSRGREIEETVTDEIDATAATDEDNDFYCDVNDLLLRLPEQLCERSCALILESSSYSRRFALMCSNAVRDLNSDLFDRIDSAYRLADVLCHGDNDVARMLYGGTACRIRFDPASRNGILVTDDRYPKASAFLRARMRDKRIDPFDAALRMCCFDNEALTENELDEDIDDDDDGDRKVDNVDRRLTTADNVMTNMNERDGSTERYGMIPTAYASTAERMLRDAKLYARAVKIIVPRETFDAQSSDNTSIVTTSSSVPSTHRRYVTSLEQITETQQRSKTVSVDADFARDYFSRWDLDRFARDNAQAFSVKRSGLSLRELRTITATYIFLLVRERERSDTFAPAKISSDTTDSNLFEELETGSWRNAMRACRSTSSMCAVRSTCTNDLARGLAYAIADEFDESRRPNDRICFAIAIAITTLYIFANGCMDVVRFFIAYCTAIRFPGQFLKSTLMLIGTSDSGKSEFVSRVLRYVYSSKTGLVNNSTLRTANQNEINTEQMSLMTSHVCQCDEPEYLHAERFKNIISDTQFTCRRFFTQKMNLLNTMAKLIITTNDAVNMKGDAGVISRLKYCYRMTHKFKERLTNDRRTRFDVLEKYATERVAYQFATRCFPKGVDNINFCIGLFAIVENYGLDLCTYTRETHFLTGDLVASKMLRLHVRGLGSGHHVYDTYERFFRLFRYSAFDQAFKRERLAKRRIATSIGNDDASKRRRTTAAARDAEGVAVTAAARDAEGVAVTAAARDAEGVAVTAAARDAEGVAVTAAARDDESENEADWMRTLNFSATTSNDLLVPIVVSIPRLVADDARNLHRSIDPYELLRHHYNIVPINRKPITETTLMNTLRSFLEESNYTNMMSRNSSLTDVARKMKERLRTEFPKCYNVATNSFFLSFHSKASSVATTATNRSRRRVKSRSAVDRR